MIYFNFPHSGYSNIDIPEGTNVRLANPMIGNPFSVPQSYLITPRRFQGGSEINGAIAFGSIEAAATEKSPRPGMRYPKPQFFNCHKNFSEVLNALITQGGACQVSYKNLYENICDTISEYDQNLIHLHDDISDVFFDYTDLVEGVFIVSKRRNIDVSEIKDILMKLDRIYNKIYSAMASNDRSGISSIASELSCIKDEIRSHGLLPTDEEYEAEISEITTTFNDEEREDLACMFRN
jgi:hypothetical protein